MSFQDALVEGLHIFVCMIILCAGLVMGLFFGFGWALSRGPWDGHLFGIAALGSIIGSAALICWYRSLVNPT